MVYKVVKGEAPFTNDQNTQKVIAASSWDELKKLFQPTARSVSAATVTMPDGIASAVFIAGHSIAGFMALMSDFVATFEAEAPTGDNSFSIPSAVIGAIGAASGGAADFLVPKDPVKNTAVSTVGTVTTVTVILAKLIFSGPAQKKFAASGKLIFRGMAVNDGRATGAIINSILIIPALFVTGYHFYELSSESSGSSRSAAIVGEVANLASYVSRISYAVAVNDKDPESKLIPIGIMATANVAVAGLQTAEAAIN